MAILDFGGVCSSSRGSISSGWSLAISVSDDGVMSNSAACSPGASAGVRLGCDEFNRRRLAGGSAWPRGPSALALRCCSASWAWSASKRLEVEKKDTLPFRKKKAEKNSCVSNRACRAICLALNILQQHGHILLSIDRLGKRIKKMAGPGPAVDSLIPLNSPTEDVRFLAQAGFFDVFFF